MANADDSVSLIKSEIAAEKFLLFLTIKPVNNGANIPVVANAQFIMPKLVPDRSCEKSILNLFPGPDPGSPWAPAVALPLS